MSTTLLVIGFFIIAILAFYAASLLFKLRQQTLQQAQAQAQHAAKIKAKSDELLNDIRYIANAMIDERCELSEGVLRIGKLFELLSLSEEVTPQFPALYTHFERIKDHPIKEQRKALKKQQRMKLDFTRMRSEAELENDILEEAKKLVIFTPASQH